MTRTRAFRTLPNRVRPEIAEDLRFASAMEDRTLTEVMEDAISLYASQVRQRVWEEHKSRKGRKKEEVL